MNVATFQTMTWPTLSPISLDFTPDGSRFAALDRNGLLRIWQSPPISMEIYRKTFPGARSLIFAGNSHLALIGKTDLHVIELQAGKSISLSLNVSSFSADERYLVAGLDDGSLILLSQYMRSIAKVGVCHKSVGTVRTVPGRDLIAYGCSEGGAGLVTFSTTEQSLTITNTFETTPEVWDIVAENVGPRILVISGHTVYVHDIETKITARMEGQGARISAIGTPAFGSRNLWVGDVNGGVRRWTLSTSRARTITRVPGLPLSSRFSPDGVTLAVYGTNPVIRLINILDNSVVELHGHTGMIGGVRFSADGRLAMSFSWDGTVRVWKVLDGSLLGTFDGHRAIVEDGDFVNGGPLTTSVGDDGRLFIWNFLTGDIRSLLVQDRPLSSLEVLSSSNEIIAQGSSGMLWIVQTTGEVKQLRASDDIEITCIRASKSGALLGLGREDGVTLVYRTSDWNIIKQLQAKGTVARIEFDPYDRDVLVLSEDGSVELAPLDARRRAQWQSFRVKAHDIGYAPDGETIAISALDGGSWFYTMPDALWLYELDHDAEVWSGQFSPSGSHFVSIDRDGLVVSRPMPLIYESN
jgi:WD40 repeat protein